MRGIKVASRLCSLVEEGNVEVRVDGPYGAESERPAWANHEVLIVFAGGIGVRLDHQTADWPGC